MKFGIGVLFLLAAAFGATVPEDNRIPVIVELFTSEGCSSCPPADELLSRLERSQPVANARVIALEQHVDYWNQLGWTDPFSAPAYRLRQNEYGRQFGVDSIYTPQMVVGGRAQFVGSDQSKAVEEIEKSANTAPHYALELHPTRNQNDGALTDLDIYVRHLKQGKPANADVYLAVTESRLSTNVPRGENAGRLLRHASIVRSFGKIGAIDPKEFDKVGLRSTLKLPENWKRENLHAVVFIQEHGGTGKIVAAATADLK